MGGKSTGSQTTTTELPPEIADILKQNYAFAQDVADRQYQPYTGKLVADLSPAQTLAGTMMTSLAGGKDDGSQALGRAIVGAQNVMNYDFGKNAIDVDPTRIATGDATMATAAKLGGPTQYDAVTGKAAGLAPATTIQASLADPATMMKAARIDPNKVSDVGTQDLTDLNLKPYMNPYEDQVVAQGTKDLDRARQLVENDIGSQASHVGAAFGSRQAVAEGENNRNFLQQVAQLSAQNRQAGYGQAADLAESDLGRRLQADTTQQATDLALRSTNAGFDQQASAANAAAKNDLSQFNATQQGATKQANQGALNQFKLTEGANKQAISLANLGYQNTAAATNAATNNDFTSQQAAYDQAVNVANAAAKNQFGLANMDATNAGRQFDTTTDLTAQTQNAANKLTNEGLNLNASSQLADMGLNKQKMGLADIQGLLGIGDMQQDQQQATLDSAYQQFLNKWNYPIQQLQILQGGAQPLTQIGQTSTSTGTTSPWSTIGNILQGVGMFAMSDARLKAEIETAGYDRKGRRWASWRYIWDRPGTKRFGVIAQEVAMTDPDAVLTTPQGLLLVDYGKLLEAA